MVRCEWLNGNWLFPYGGLRFEIRLRQGYGGQERPRWDSPGEVAKALHGVNFHAPKR